MDRAVRSSDELDWSRELRRARRAGLFEWLEGIYSELPDTVCDNCARCCFESPGIFFVEHLYLLDILSRMSPRRREELVQRSFRELLFSWIEPDRTCVFLEHGRCAIYERRPLACRLFGLVPARDREQAEAQARLAARGEASRLKLLGIEVPEAVVSRSLVSCDRVRDRHGNRVEVDGEEFAGKVAQLDAQLLPQETVVQEFCFRSLPERIGAAALGPEAVEGMRVQLLRRAQRGETIADLLALSYEKVELPPPLRRRPTHPRASRLRRSGPEQSD